jgi:hypothetical protein
VSQPPIPRDNPIVRHLWTMESSTPRERVQVVIQAYEEEAGNRLRVPPSADELGAIRTWMHELDDDMPTNELGHSVSLYRRNRSVSEPLVHPGAAEKASWLQQAPCITCLRAEDVYPLSIAFGINTRPFSAQALGSEDLRTLKAKIKASVTGRLTTANDWRGYQLCVRVVAVVGRTDPVKDVDNMAKGLLDSLQESAYDNDRDIAHLSIERFRHQGDEGWYGISIKPVRNPLEDVVNPWAQIAWLGQPEITI